MKTWRFAKLAVVCVLSACAVSCISPHRACMAALPAAAFRDTKIKIAFTGDLMAHQQQLDRAETNGVWDFTPSFEAVRGILSAADFAIGNLETTLAGGGYAGYPCFSTPDSYAEALKGAGFDLLTTSNNHCLDTGFDGLARTVKVLRGMGFRTIGTSEKKNESGKPLLCDINGVRAVFVAWTYGTNGIQPPYGKEWAVSYLSEEAVSRDLAAARSLSPDIIIALPHFGDEYKLAPPENVRRDVALMLDCGADAVVAGHPHVLQKFEFVKKSDESGSKRDAFVAWSMGNFISFQRTKPRDVGAILELEIEKNPSGTFITSARVIPTWVQVRTSDGAAATRALPFASALGEPTRWKMRLGDIYKVNEARQGVVKDVLGLDTAPDAKTLSFKITKK